MKRKRSAALILLICIIFSNFFGCIELKKSQANSISVNTNETEKNEEINLLEKTMKTITTDEYAGRLVGDKGNDLTINYIENVYKDLGLEKFENNSYFHTFNYNVVDVLNSDVELKVQFEDGNIKEYECGKDFVVSKNEGVNLTAEVTFDENDKDILNKIYVTDKLVRNKVKAKAILHIKNSFSGNYIITKSTAVQISKQVYEELKHNKVKNISIKSDYKTKNSYYKNVIGKISGKNKKNALILSAHFDHVGYDGKMIYKGAIDNASGTSLLLDLAKKLKEKSNKKKFDMDILICAFNAEELGLIGSKAFAKGIKDKYENIYNINLDCVGKKNGGTLIVDNLSKENEELSNDFAKYLEKAKINFRVENGFEGSDHISFFDEGICAIELGQEDCFEEPTAIHTAGDTIDVVDYQYLYNLEKAIYNFIIDNGNKTYKRMEQCKDK